MSGFSLFYLFLATFLTTIAKCVLTNGVRTCSNYSLISYFVHYHLINVFLLNFELVSLPVLPVLLDQGGEHSGFELPTEFFVLEHEAFHEHAQRDDLVRVLPHGPQHLAQLDLHAPLDLSNDLGLVGALGSELPHLRDLLEDLLELVDVGLVVELRQPKLLCARLLDEFLQELALLSCLLPEDVVRLGCVVFKASSQLLVGAMMKSQLRLGILQGLVLDLFGGGESF